MSDALEPVTRPRLFEQVMSRLQEHVQAAGLKAGDRLPSERTLAERLRVSRASLKQAIVVLEVQGLVEIRHGGGTYLRADSLALEPVAALEARRQRLPDVLEAREAIETKLAQLAAQRRTDEDLSHIYAALELMRSEIDEGLLGVDGDRMFHEAVTTAAHSALLAKFMIEMTSQIAESRQESLQQPRRPSKSLVQHERVADAIRRRDGRAAATAMRTHLETVSRVRLLSWIPEGD
jgi:GntR family transcriptional regulator, transcriptional repressor for pyruvate dehydrogenase complex